MKKRLSIYLSSFCVGLPIIVASAACSNPNTGASDTDTLSDQKHLKTSLLGKELNAFEVNRRIENMLANNQSSAEIIDYINQFIDDKINNQKYEFVKSEIDKDSLKLTLKDTNKNQLTIFIDQFQKYEQKDSESGKKVSGWVNLGDIEINTVVGDEAKKLDADEFKRFIEKKNKEFKNDGYKLLKFLRDNNYLEIKNLDENSKWKYTYIDKSHTHGLYDFHAYFVAEDKKTGKLFREYDENGQPGFSLKGWKRILKVGEIWVPLTIKVNKDAQKSKLAEFKNSFKNASSIKQKIEIIHSISNAKFGDLEKVDLSKYNYSLELIETQNKLNEIILKASVKSKEATENDEEDNKSNTVYALIKDFDTEISAGNYQFNTSIRFNGFDVNQIKGILGAGSNSEHPQKVEEETFEELSVPELKTVQEVNEFLAKLIGQKDKTLAFSIEKIKEFIFEAEITDDDKYTAEDKKYVNSLIDVPLSKGRVQKGQYSLLVDKVNSASSLEQKISAVKELHKLILETRKKLSDLVLNTNKKLMDERIKFYKQQNIKYTSLEKLYEQNNEFLNASKHPAFEKVIELSENISEELNDFLYGDQDSLTFEQVMSVLKNKIGVQFSKFIQSDDKFEYKFDNKSVKVTQNHYNSEYNIKESNNKIVSFSAQITEKSTKKTSDITVNLVFNED
ncbi:hypothetical protein E1I18_03300 [Mycoplasmopsis mucosicanis]|uniref:Lipoprotein n=1 Tax=Mycoplasmopsis mucosicanis TaxID=458208 RepID=A0A507SM02_9BACT|nr:hypothetical protein [Mycoplasmopsis mucosicanis]TQC51295.1 hypothetical protein E1I18_03300 [Mycoplasmopsis mucosicanis]